MTTVLEVRGLRAGLGGRPAVEVDALSLAAGTLSGVVGAPCSGRGCGWSRRTRRLLMAALCLFPDGLASVRLRRSEMASESGDG